ncbi:hypothetical protein [Novipirellula galeiformis]|uniref:hypothetical protein n=1 Tax=Novipirellula galeiformis TaxID=2528004 RepID=UPI0018CCA086|nr:hypothetical protein [Novipirellula galeiformis]
MTAPSPAKEGRFPCETCSCGCATAAYCWDQCCCHTDAEKLRWANTNAVAAPSFLVARVKERSPSNPIAFVSRSHDTPPSASSCCPQNTRCTETSSSCHDGVAEPRRSCGSAVKDKPTIRIIRLEDAAKCHGISSWWVTIAHAVVDPPSPVPTKIAPPLLYSFTNDHLRPISLSYAPDPPVPWHYRSSLRLASR